jgi:hypothetical protein
VIDFGGQEIGFNSARKEKRIVLELREDIDEPEFV